MQFSGDKMDKRNKKKYEERIGDPVFLGAVTEHDGMTFSVAVPDEKDAQLVITDRKGHEVQYIDLPAEKRIGEVSSVFLKDASPEEVGYYYVIDGEKTRDPYASEIRGHVCLPLCPGFDWEDDKAPHIPLNNLMIYKLHVRGFTKKAGASVKHKGTFGGVAEKIPYIRELGFNAVELMPVYEFEDNLRVQPFSGTAVDEQGRTKALTPKNYWGYAEKNYYFAPKESYSWSGDACTEFRNMVKEMHRAGIEVFMEMYFPPQTDPYMALRVIHYWKSVYHVDGFHFIGEGTPLESIIRDPLLKKTTLMLERVDSSWIYGNSLPRFRNLLEYNDDFEHTCRALLKGDEGQIEAFSTFIRRNPPTHSHVNYMANVNGFTLYDSVCYDWKHNEENGEGNQDGTHLNYSWNCGAEGPSRKKAVKQLRIRQIKNALTYVFLAQGVPLLYAGDEMLNTQNGNNNAYSSDNPIGWVDWNNTKDAVEIRDFVKMLTGFRRENQIFHMSKELKGTDYKGYGFPDISFHDSKAWITARDFVTRTLAVLYCGLYTREETGTDSDFFYIAYNAYWDTHPFAIPVLPKEYRWQLEFTTSGETERNGELEAGEKYIECPPRSVSVLRGRKIRESVEHESDRTSENNNKTS